MMKNIQAITPIMKKSNGGTERPKSAASRKNSPIRFPSSHSYQMRTKEEVEAEERLMCDLRWYYLRLHEKSNPGSKSMWDSLAIARRIRRQSTKEDLDLTYEEYLGLTGMHMALRWALGMELSGDVLEPSPGQAIDRHR